MRCNHHQKIIVYGVILLIGMLSYRAEANTELPMQWPPEALVSQTTPSATKTSPLTIFVSFSMPKHSLRQWFSQAERYQAPVVLRGLVDHSFKKTLHAFRSLWQDKQQPQGGLQINPVTFQRFGITQVPAVVLVDPAHPQQFDVIYGDISLTAALQWLSRHGQYTQAIAQSLLKTSS